MHTQKPQQQRPDHVLVHRVEPCPAIHQIKGYFRKQCKQQQPQDITLQVSGVNEGLTSLQGVWRCPYNRDERQVLDMRFVFRMIVFPFWLLTAFLALMLKWTLNLSAFVLALPMLYIFGCGLYTLYCREWMQFLILLVAEFGCFVLIFVGALIADAAERFSGWVAGL